MIDPGVHSSLRLWGGEQGDSEETAVMVPAGPLSQADL